MSGGRRYPNAPITEAIIDLRVGLPEPFDSTRLKRAHDGQESAYPRTEQLAFATGRIQVGREVGATASSRPCGYRFWSEDGRSVYQARTDGFTLSRLAPYDHWEPFRDEARCLWEIYRRVVEPSKIERIAVRYVNRIDIPLPLRDFGDYLRTFPELSPDMPQALSRYLMRLEIPLGDTRSTCFLTQAVVPPASQDVVSIALDIDVFRTSDIPEHDDAIWEIMETLRQNKNSLFEACITDAARELFE